MTERHEVRHLYALLMELPKEVREEIIVDEFELAHGKEPMGETERINWYRVAFSRLVQPSWRRAMVNGGPAPDFEMVLKRVREEVVERQDDPAKEVGVFDG